MIKDILFSIFGYVGIIAIILILTWIILELLNKIFKFLKYIILYQQYKKDKDLYSNKNNIILTQHGTILYSCCDRSLDELLNTLDVAKGKIQEKKKLQEEYAIKF